MIPPPEKNTRHPVAGMLAALLLTALLAAPGCVTRACAEGEFACDEWCMGDYDFTPCTGNSVDIAEDCSDCGGNACEPHHGCCACYSGEAWEAGESVVTVTGHL